MKSFIRGTTRAVVMLYIIISVTGCGGSANQLSEGDAGYIQLEVENAYQPANISLPEDALSEKAQSATGPKGQETLRVTKFKVTISGQDIVSPIVAEAQADSRQMQVLGIPPGTDRSVLIEAFNSSDEVIRRRLIDGITINAGVVTPLRTSLNTIPLIMNFRNNSVIISKYFHVVGFGEPGSVLKVESDNDSQKVELSQSVAGQTNVISPSESEGLFDFRPDSIPLGKQKITLVDKNTGESSSRTVVLVDAEDRPGTRFVSASAKGMQLTAGSASGGAPGSHFPLVMKTLLDGSSMEVQR